MPLHDNPNQKSLSSTFCSARHVPTKNSECKTSEKIIALALELHLTNFIHTNFADPPKRGITKREKTELKNAKKTPPTYTPFV